MPARKFNWDQCLQYAVVSDVGMRRANNQDAHMEVLAGDMSAWHGRGHVFVVADGMGAHAAGELASKMAADAVPHLYQKHGELPPPEAIMAAVREANDQIHERGEANVEFRNMGTTCSTLLLLPQGALVAHVGDSRVYRLRGQRLQQLTFDHSLVWEMRAAGHLPLSDDQTFGIPKNVITRSLGPHPSVQVDLEGPLPLEVGDVFLLCSDGLTGQVHDDELGVVLANLEPKEAAPMLVDLANLRGGPDNITVIIVKIVGSEITTRAARAEPLTVGGDYEIKRTVHPAVWVVMGVLLLAGLVVAMAGYPIVAAIALIGGVIAAAVGILQKFGPTGRAGVTLASGRRLGRGPHREINLDENRPFLDRLSAELRDWRQAAIDNGTSIDWSRFDRYWSEATELAERNEWAAALHRLSQAAHLLAEQLPAQRNIWTGDSYRENID